MGVASELSAAGILLDIVGASVLARALVLEDPAAFVPALAGRPMTMNYASIIGRAYACGHPPSRHARCG